MGKTIDAKIDPKDTNLVQVTTTIKVTKELPIAKGANARKVPALVATPLPPLNFIKGENVCPKIAKKEPQSSRTLARPAGRLR